MSTCNLCGGPAVWNGDMSKGAPMLTCETDNCHRVSWLEGQQR